MTGIESQYQTFGRRLTAILIDGFILFPLIRLDRHFADNAAAEAGLFFWGLAVALVPVAYSVSMHAFKGQTIGKMVCNIKVMRLDEKRHCTLVHALVRDIYLLASAPFIVWIYYVDAFDADRMSATFSPLFYFAIYSVAIWVVIELVSMLFHKRGRSVQDLIARTVVIKI